MHAVSVGTGNGTRRPRRHRWRRSVPGLHLGVVCGEGLLTFVATALDEQYRNERVFPTSGYTTMRFNGSSAYSDGSEYIGEWRDGAPHGRGTLATRNGMYVGHFALGKKVGKGVFSTRSGDELGGEWADGGRYHEDTGTNWGGVLNGKGYAKYRANAQVAAQLPSGCFLAV